jgi:glycosidase
MFTSNHDENSWSGTEFEREGAAADACAVLCFTLPGSQPLIYTGQEIGLSRRLEFFEKDPITDWSANEYTVFWKKLVDLKHDNPALAAGEKGGPIEYIDAPDGVIAFRRKVKGNTVVVAANFGVAPDFSTALEMTEEGEEKESAEATDNRPAGETGGTPFLNLNADPVEVSIPLKGTFTNWFTGEKVSKKLTVTLAPGEYVVLTK